jgi:hypothetical protein
VQNSATETLTSEHKVCTQGTLFTEMRTIVDSLGASLVTG